MKKIKFLIGTVLIIIGLLIFSFYISFGYGSFFGFLAEYRTLPKEEKLTSLRNETVENLSQSHSEFGSISGLTFYEKTFSDMCAKGEHGWKREDSFAYVCSYRLTYYYGTNREYKELLLDLEQTLSNLGWSIQIRSPKQPTISEAISEYSGKIFLVDLPVYVKKVSGNRTTYLKINGFNGYGGYWNIGNEEPTPFGFGVGINQVIYENQSNKSPEEIYNWIISSNQQPIMITISGEYFKN